jgi:hypothetical protein
MSLFNFCKRLNKKLLHQNTASTHRNDQMTSNIEIIHSQPHDSMTENKTGNTKGQEQMDKNIKSTESSRKRWQHWCK